MQGMSKSVTSFKEIKEVMNCVKELKGFEVAVSHSSFAHALNSWSTLKFRSRLSNKASWRCLRLHLLTPKATQSLTIKATQMGYVSV